MTTDQDRLNRLADALAEDILNASDEDILAEAEEDGTDVDGVRAIALGVLRRLDGAQP